MSLALWEITTEKGKLNIMSTMKLAEAKNFTSLNCLPSDCVVSLDGTMCAKICAEFLCFYLPGILFKKRASGQQVRLEVGYGKLYRLKMNTSVALLGSSARDAGENPP